jgi:hypothetical protein
MTLKERIQSLAGWRDLSYLEVYRALYDDYLEDMRNTPPDERGPFPYTEDEVIDALVALLESTPTEGEA